jgi:hypothetical protein
MESNRNTGYKATKSRPTVSTRPDLFQHSPVAHAVPKQQKTEETAGGLNRPQGKTRNKQITAIQFSEQTSRA